MIVELHCYHTSLYCHDCQRHIVYDYISSYQSEMFLQFLFFEGIICGMFVNYDHVEIFDNVCAMN
jgi:hypothetical protein